MTELELTPDQRAEIERRVELASPHTIKSDEEIRRLETAAFIRELG